MTEIPASPSYTQRRRFKRHKMDSRVAILDNQAFRFERALEISEGGMLIQSYQPVHLGRPLEVQFFLPNGTFVSMSGEVAYILGPNSREYFVGIRFRANPPAQQAIRDFIATVAK